MGAERIELPKPEGHAFTARLARHYQRSRELIQGEQITGAIQRSLIELSLLPLRFVGMAFVRHEDHLTGSRAEVKPQSRSPLCSSCITR